MSFATSAVKSSRNSRFLWCKEADRAVEGSLPIHSAVSEVSVRGQRGEICFHCCSSVSNKPIFRYVTNYDHFSSRVSFGPGKFCEPECVIGHLEETGVSGNATAFTKWFLIEHCGVSHRRIKPALPRCSLKKFGGILAPEKNKEHRNIFLRGAGGKEASGTRFYSNVTGIPYAMILEVQREKGMRENELDEELALNGKTKGLRRPLTRQVSSIAKCKSTGEEPLLLNLFAKLVLKEKATGKRGEETKDEGDRKDREEREDGVAEAPSPKRTRQAAPAVSLGDDEDADPQDSLKPARASVQRRRARVVSRRRKVTGSK